MRYTLTLAAGTVILKTLLDNGLIRHGVTARLGGEVNTSALPPDRVQVGTDERSQLNLFLYQITQKGLTASSRYGAAEDRQRPPDAPMLLELLYLVTAYGAQDYHSEILLGYALEQLNAHPVLDKAQVREMLDAIAHSASGRAAPPALAALSDTDLTGDIGSIRICPQITTTQEIQNLWSTFQTAYRPSATYKVTVELTVPAPATTENV